MDFSLLLSSYATVWSNPEVLLMTFIGALGGVLLGAIPGMTATMGVALLIPFSFGMDLIPSIGLLLGIYCGGMYGGSISAILIHAPGTPAAAATLLDGYPMCKKGQAGKALSVAMFASFCGGVIGALVMTFLSPLVADMAMNFGPGEMFMLAVFGLSVIVAISGKSVAKGLISAFFGMLLCTVGLDPTNGIPRFITTKQTGLLDGFQFIPTLIGLFAVSEVIAGVSASSAAKSMSRSPTRRSPTCCLTGRPSRRSGPTSSPAAHRHLHRRHPRRRRRHRRLRLLRRQQVRQQAPRAVRHRHPQRRCCYRVRQQWLLRRRYDPPAVSGRPR